MRKIPTLFVRDANDRKHSINKVTQGCEWVIAGEGVATRKYDGTACLVKDGKLYKRYEARYELPLPVEGGAVKSLKPLPEGFIAADWIDEKTGKQPGWVPVGDGPDDRWHREALENMPSAIYSNGETFELCGPKIQRNPEKLDKHLLIIHSVAERVDAPRDYDGLRDWLLAHEFEGIVWHHEDGRMAKLKKRDFPKP